MDSDHLKGPPDRRYLPLASCTEPFELDFEGTSRFGLVKKGVIRLQAELSLRTADLYFPDTEDAENPGHHPHTENAEDPGPELVPQAAERTWKPTKPGSFSWRVDTSDTDLRTPLVLAPIRKVLDGDKLQGFEGLLLRPMSNPRGRYQRVGVFRACKDWVWKELTTPSTDDEDGRMPEWYEEKIELGSSTTYLFTIE